MSCSYDIILLLGAYNAQGYGQADNEPELPPKAITEVNHWIASSDANGELCALTRLTDRADSCYGIMRTDVWATVIKALDVAAFLQAVEAASWPDADNIQVLIRGPESQTCTVFNIRNGKIIDPHSGAPFLSSQFHSVQQPV